MMVGGGALALALVALLAYGMTRGEPADDTLDPSAASVDPAPVAEGAARLWVDGLAAVGATVLIDGDSVGTMPLWLDRVDEGRRRIQVIGPDGVPLADTVLTTVAGTTTDVIFDPLMMPIVSTDIDAPSPADAASASASRLDLAGSLRVTSSPSGAVVTLDGRRMGATPLSLDGLRPGGHSISVARQGFEETVRQVDVRQDRALDVAISLRPLAPPPSEAAPRSEPTPRAEPAPRAEPVGTGTLEVLVQPWGRIVIDGTVHRRETDVVYRTTLPAGAHRVTVSHPQLGSAERTVTVEPGVQSRIEFDLRETATGDGAPGAGGER